MSGSASVATTPASVHHTTFRRVARSGARTTQKITTSTVTGSPVVRVSRSPKAAAVASVHVVRTTASGEAREPAASMKALSAYVFTSVRL